MGAMIRTSDPRVTRIMAQKQEQTRAGGRTYRNIPSQSGSFADRFPDGCWSGQRCFIIGGGPSLKGFDFNRLRGERVIAVNKAYFDAPFADIMFAMDKELIDLIMSGQLGEPHRQAFEEFKGTKLWLDISSSSYPVGIYSVPVAGDIGWTRSLVEGLYHGNNSGYGALNLALVLGANPIYLLGYDCSLGPAGEKHYHGGYVHGFNPDAVDKFKSNLEAGAKLLEGKSRIINLNPQSALKCFEFDEVDEVLPKAAPITVQGGKITAITPTGDRPLAFALCQQWMRHQTRQPGQWIVVDDGKTLLAPTAAMQYVRREPRPDDPQHTLALNLQAALPLITGDKILIMEDDDYYAPEYIAEVARKLDQHEIVGITQAKYYHLPTGGYHTHQNASHCSLSETSFRNSFLPEFKEILHDNNELVPPHPAGTAVDLRIWRKVGNRGYRFNDNEKPLYLGIKGLPGRAGIGIGHNPVMYRGVQDTADRAMLKKWVPGDYQIYLDILSGKLNDENYRSYFQPAPLPITGITVCWNTKDLIERAYNSIRKLYPDMPIIIIDGSDAGDPCAAYVRGLASDVTTVVQPGQNIGHGRGMCLGIERAKTPYALIFDSDIELLEPCLPAMLAMMEDDTFGVGDIDERAEFNRFAYGSHGRVDGWVRYLQPYFQLIDIGNYRKFYPYVHHGAPCYLTMLDIHQRELSGKILKQFPGLSHFSDKERGLATPPGEYVRHDHAATRAFRSSKHLPDIEGEWVLNKGLV